MKNSVIITIVRVVLGIIFLSHGISKLQMGLGNVSDYLSSTGLPGLLAYAVAALELIGGVLLIVGLFSRYVSALFGIMMLGAIITMKTSAGLLGENGMAGYELELGLLMTAIMLTLSEPTSLSVDGVIRSRSKA